MTYNERSFSIVNNLTPKPNRNGGYSNSSYFKQFQVGKHTTNVENFQRNHVVDGVNNGINHMNGQLNSRLYTPHSSFNQVAGSENRFSEVRTFINRLQNIDKMKPTPLGSEIRHSQNPNPHSPISARNTSTLNESKPIDHITSQHSSAPRYKGHASSLQNVESRFKPMRLKNEDVLGRDSTQKMYIRRQSAPATSHFMNSNLNYINNPYSENAESIGQSVGENSVHKVDELGLTPKSRLSQSLYAYERNLLNNPQDEILEHENSVIHRVNIEGITKSRLGTDYAVVTSQIRDHAEPLKQDSKIINIHERENELQVSHRSNKDHTTHRRYKSNNSTRGNFKPNNDSHGIEGVNGVPLSSRQDSSTSKPTSSSKKGKRKYDRPNIKRPSLASLSIGIPQSKYLVSENILDRELDRTMEYFYNIVTENLSSSYGVHSKKGQRMVQKLKSLLDTYSEIRDETTAWRQKHNDKQNYIHSRVQKHHIALHATQKDFQRLKDESIKEMDKFKDGLKTAYNIITSAIEGTYDVKQEIDLFKKIDNPGKGVEADSVNIKSSTKLNRSTMTKRKNILINSSQDVCEKNTTPRQERKDHSKKDTKHSYDMKDYAELISPIRERNTASIRRWTPTSHKLKDSQKKITCTDGVD